MLLSTSLTSSLLSLQAWSLADFERTVASIGLHFSEPSLFFLVAILGYLLLSESKFSMALMLLLFTMVYNGFLKTIWQTPLPPASGLQGWAFPSGHMHGAFIFWGWLAFSKNHRYLTLLIFILLSLSAFGLVYKHYHYPVDIIGSILLGSLTLVGFHFLNLFEPFKTRYALNGIGLSVGAILLLIFTPEIGRKPHLYQAMGGLLGFTLGSLYASKRIVPQKRAYGALKNILSTLGVIFIAILLFRESKWLQLQQPQISHSVVVCVSGFVIAAWIASSKRLFRMTLKP